MNYIISEGNGEGVTIRWNGIELKITRHTRNPFSPKVIRLSKDEALVLANLIQREVH